jgi:hypothetical protein
MWSLSMPLKEITLLPPVLGTDVELSAIVGIELGDLAQYALTSVATLGMVQVSPGKVIARFLTGKKEQKIHKFTYW